MHCHPMINISPEVLRIVVSELCMFNVFNLNLEGTRACAKYSKQSVHSVSVPLFERNKFRVSNLYPIRIGDRSIKMAKSLRSKWRRKCRAVKRERYGEKELARLKKTLGIDEKTSNDVEMSEISEIATVVDAKTVKKQAKNKEAATDSESMDVDGRVYDKKTLRDQYGNYPAWMHRRKIMKHKRGRAKTDKSHTKPGKRLTRKQKKAAKAK